jgi:flagellar basal-body rod protein FlgC
MYLFRHTTLLIFFLMATFLLVTAAHAQDALVDAMSKASAGMDVQSSRLKVVAENLANAETLGTKPGGDPYRRKIIYFKNKRDPRTNLTRVIVKKIDSDKTPFKLKYDPYHPLANGDGYIVQPNVERLIENMDIKEAEYSYQANLNMLDVARTMRRNTLDLLR